MERDYVTEEDRMSLEKAIVYKLDKECKECSRADVFYHTYCPEHYNFVIHCISQ